MSQHLIAGSREQNHPANTALEIDTEGKMHKSPLAFHPSCAVCQKWIISNVQVCSE